MQPEPWAAPSGWRAPGSRSALAVEEDVDGLVAVAAGHDHRARARARARPARAPGVLRAPRRPRSTRASGTLGVTTVARGSESSTSAACASSSSSRAPDSATMTGSTTTGVPAASRSSASATARDGRALPSMPILTASTPMSVDHRAHLRDDHRRRDRLDRGRRATVFCAVIAVIAVMPWTPQRAKAFRSAWMPAPPPESEPAIDRHTGMRPEPGTAAKDRPGVRLGPRCGRPG